MMHTTRYFRILLAALLLAAPAAHAGETGAAVKADELKTEPFRDAKTVGKLAPGDKVEILKKDGGWFRVKSARGSGWVRMLSIRRGEARKSLDVLAPDAEQVVLRLMFADARHPEFELALWDAALAGETGSPGEALRLGRRWLSHLEALLKS